MSADMNEKACSEQTYHVTRDALPLSCPMPKMRLWDAHPKVYLPIDKTGESTCPYCGAHYILDDK